MAHVVKRLPRGNTAALNAYTGPAGELAMDTQTNELVLQNGTKGGVRIGNKIGTATVGSASQPVYIKAGTPTACTDMTKLIADAISDSITGTSANATALKNAINDAVANALNGTNTTITKAVEAAVANAIDAALKDTGTNTPGAKLKEAIAKAVDEIFTEAAANPQSDIGKSINSAISSVLSSVFEAASDPDTADEQAQALRTATTGMIAGVLEAVINGGSDATAQEQKLQKNLVDLIVKSAQESESLSSALKTVLGIPVMLTANKTIYVDGTNGVDSPTYKQAITAGLMKTADVPKSVTTPDTTKVPETTLVGIKWGSKTGAAFKTITAACTFAAKWYNQGAYRFTVLVAGGQYAATSISAPSRTTGDFIIEPYSTVKETSSTLDSSNNVITRLQNKIYDGSTCTTTTYEDVRIVLISDNGHALYFTESNTETYFRHIAVVTVYAPTTSTGNKYPYCAGIVSGADVYFRTCEFWNLSALILRKTAPAVAASSADNDPWVDTRGVTVSGTARFGSCCSFISAFVDLFGLENLSDNYYSTTSGAATRKFFRGTFATKAAFNQATIDTPAYGDIVKVTNDESIGGGVNYYYFGTSGSWSGGRGNPSERNIDAIRTGSGAVIHFDDTNTNKAQYTYFYGSCWYEMMYGEDSRTRFDGGSTYSPRIVSACPTALIKTTTTSSGTAPTNPAGNVLHVQNGDKYTTYTFVDWYTRDMRAVEGGYEYRPLTPLAITGLSWKRFDRKRTVHAANTAETFNINIDAAGTITVHNVTQNADFTTQVERCRVVYSANLGDGANARAVRLPLPNDPKILKLSLVAGSNSTWQGSVPKAYKDYEEVKYGVVTESRSSFTFNDTNIADVRLS